MGGKWNSYNHHKDHLFPTISAFFISKRNKLFKKWIWQKGFKEYLLTCKPRWSKTERKKRVLRFLLPVSLFLLTKTDRWICRINGKLEDLIRKWMEIFFLKAYIFKANIKCIFKNWVRKSIRITYPILATWNQMVDFSLMKQKSLEGKSLENRQIKNFKN